MDKIICDICGTAYPESQENCPVCGCSRDFILEEEYDDFSSAAAQQAEQTDGDEEYPRRKNREIFDYDEVNQPRRPARELEDEDFEDEEEYEEEERTNTGLVVVLVILIVLLLLTSGFLFVKYFMPNMTEPEPTVPTVVTRPVETEPVETEPAGIPCTDLVIPGGKVELGEGGLWLMNVQVYPADTTDTLTYLSGDEAVVTVSEDGLVTAVGEGSTIITVSCGEVQIKCNVTVDYSLVSATEPEGELPALQVEEEPTEAAQETDPAEETTGAAEETQPQETDAEENTEETSAAGVELKLKKTDISIFSNYTSVKLELDCDIKPEEVYWLTMDSTVAIVNNGIVTSTGSGMTRIYGEYEGQRVECIVRCQF